MSYTMKNQENFLKYIKNITVLYTGDEEAIKNFDSSSLFDLYTLLEKIKNDRQINSEMQNKLKDTIKNRYPKAVYNLFSFPVTKEVLYKFEEYLKNLYFAYIQEYHQIFPNNTSDEDKLDTSEILSLNISEDEIKKISIIVAKKYPDKFLNYIKEEKDPKVFELEKNFINNRFLNMIDEYTNHTENMQNNVDIQTGFYTALKNKFPNCRFATTGRKKSFNSTSNNIQKEFRKNLDNIIPSNLSNGITYNDIEKNFNFSKVSDDFYGFTVYIKGIDDTFHVDEDIKHSDIGKKFMKYRKLKQKNISIYHSLHEFIDNPYSFLDFTEEDYLQIKIELLDKLQYLTFQECSEEYSGILFKPQDDKDRGTCFSKLLSQSLNDYKAHLEANDFKKELSDDEHWEYQQQLSSLLDEFKNRLYDQYEFSVLQIIIPQIVKDTNYSNENILRDQLDVKLISSKTVIKRNGFCAIYNILGTPDGRKIEVQFQTNMRYRDSKIGTSDHSRMDNKQLDISQFFELKDNLKNDKNYDSILKNSINILNSTTVAERNYLLSTPDKELVSEQKKRKRDIEFAQKNLKIKELYEDKHFLPDGTNLTAKYTLEQYLPIFAKYHSPKLIAVSSAHSRVNTNTAFVVKKNLVENLRELLLKTDETTCLADMLLNRLKQIQEKDSVIVIGKNSLIDTLQSHGISKEIIHQILLEANTKAGELGFSYTNSVNDIKKRVNEKINLSEQNEEDER